MTQTITMDSDSALAQALRANVPYTERRYLVLRDENGAVEYSGAIQSFSFTPGAEVTAKLERTEAVLQREVDAFADVTRAKYERAGLL
ncbi:hypothetical protein PBI_MRMAGOO_73 [Mycobacterium phage MrMagoo]|uniref:Uncharacterized protein n=1 Tax=Mycobacterium phage MrMagoo TaxID=1927020 RepID=A0A1L6BYK0_9CAUD|nr:hypothetical protein J4U04_gp073 [Mycobacterium phage MrMagoo]APQ42177.1 hypothetical protein PBI_MRMAGOO_73 [Mycobacterium phage MrMagoo]ARM70252.1 hypothetical protein SEA_GARDENSALSA_72 [Mycobacterium phage GardenSalsa]